MNRKVALALLTGLLACTTIVPLCRAQSKGDLELGMDATVTTNPGGGSVWILTVPAQNFRIGFFPSDVVRIEPNVSLISIFRERSDQTAVSLSIDADHLMRGVGKRSTYYIGTGITYDYVSERDFSGGQIGGKVEVGTMVPVGLEDLYIRIHLLLGRRFENSNFRGTTVLGLGVGASVFAR